MFKTSDFTECYVIEMGWVGDMKDESVRVKVTQRNIYNKYLKKLDVRIIYDNKTGFIYKYPAIDISGAHNERTRFVYCKEFVDAYRVINYYKTRALRVISMVGYVKQNAELGFDNLTSVDFGNEKISIDDYLN